MDNHLHCTPQAIIRNDCNTFQRLVDKRRPCARRPKKLCKNKPTVCLAVFLSPACQSDKFKKLHPAQYVRQEEISQNQDMVFTIFQPFENDECEPKGQATARDGRSWRLHNTIETTTKCIPRDGKGTEPTLGSFYHSILSQRACSVSKLLLRPTQ